MKQFNPSTKVRYANQALVSYHNQMLKTYPDLYGMEFNTLLNYLLARDNNFLESFGQLVAMNSGTIGIRRLDEAMERVVLKSKNGIPAHVSAFGQGLVDELKDFDWSLFGDAALSGAKDVIEAQKTVVKTVKEVGGGIGDNISFLAKNLKWIILGVLGVVLIGGGIILKGKLS